jgi:hypothetical protein
MTQKIENNLKITYVQEQRIHQFSHVEQNRLGSRATKTIGDE